MYYVNRFYGYSESGYKIQICKRYNYKWIALLIANFQWIFDLNIKEIIVVESSDACYMVFHKMR